MARVINDTLKRLIRPVVPMPVIQAYHRRKRLAYIAGLQCDIDPKRKTILAVNHHCDQDYAAITVANDRFNILEVMANTLFLGSSNYFTDEVEGIRAPYSQEPADHLRSYRRESRLIFDKLRERFPIDVILVPNDNYFFIRELIDIARMNGVPTVILDKEGIITPHSYYAESKRARDFTPFVADHIFAWSYRQKDFWMEKEVSADRITVVGQPRSDLLFQPPGRQLNEYFATWQPLVTVFTYLDTAYMPLDYIDKYGASWKAMKTKTHEVVRDLAVRHPDFNFVIKCHPQQRDYEAIRDECESKNVRVISGSSLGNELILRSELIIAFQTTALIEAMLVGRNAVYTAWDPHIAVLQDHLLPFTTAGGLVIARSPEMLREVVDRFLSGDARDFSFSESDLVRRRAFVGEYLYEANGHASERFLVALERFLS
jgi:hypothetical protein